MSGIRAVAASGNMRSGDRQRRPDLNAAVQKGAPDRYFGALMGRFKVQS